MSKHQMKIVGKVTHVFAHRFVVQADDNAVLCDLTPHGSEKVILQIGDHVQLDGEMKPSELKVTRLSRNGEKGLEFDHHKRKEHHSETADPNVAFKAAKAAGFETFGAARRKPRHFEVLARRDNQLVELHIELDGHIRKVKSEFEKNKWGDFLPVA
jgi:hypothetical protein